MKRFCALFLLFFYAASASGMTFHLHFCGKELQDVSLAGFGHSGCCCGKAKSKAKAKSCCTDKLVSFKAGKEYKRAESSGTPVSIPKNMPPATTVFQLSFSTCPISPAPNFHSPPIRAGGEELFLLHNVFRI